MSTGEALRHALDSRDIEEINRVVEFMERIGNDPDQIWGMVEKVCPSMSRAEWDIMARKCREVGRG